MLNILICDDDVRITTQVYDLLCKIKNKHNIDLK